MMQHPAGVDDVERAHDVTELENVGLCILNVRQAQLLRLSPGIADAAQAQVYRQHTNAAESLGNEDRITAGAAPGDKYLRCTVVRHWRKWRERQRATQFGIERQRLFAHLPFLPARVALLFLLVSH